MNLVEITPIDLFKVREVLEDSRLFLKSNNLGAPESYTHKLFLEELPGSPKIYSLEEKNEVLGFVKLVEQFPLPGFVQIRLLVFKEEHCSKGHGTRLIKKLKTSSKATLWASLDKDELSLRFWEGNGFKEEAGRWVLT